MNILIVTAYPPVLHLHGGGVRMFHNIRLLSQRHSVHVLSFVGNSEEQDSLETVKPICESVRGVLRIPDFRPHWLSLKPFLVREFSTPEMHRAVDETLKAKKIRVLQCEYLQMAQFRREGVFSILTAHEVMSKNTREAFEGEIDPLEKLRLFYRWMQTLNYETAQVRKFDRVITMTTPDAEYLRSYALEANIRAIPIGIDPEEFCPRDSGDGPPSVLFVGNFLHSPNVEAANFLVRELAPRLKDIKFLIVGSPVPENLPTAENVELAGHVPDTRALYQGSNTIVVAPMFSGSGQRVKLLEAFSMCCPVVTTSVGAAGFPIEDGAQVFLAETAIDFERAVRRLVADTEVRKRMGQNARTMIRDRFTWTRIGGEFLDVVSEAAVSN